MFCWPLCRHRRQTRTRSSAPSRRWAAGRRQLCIVSSIRRIELVTTGHAQGAVVLGGPIERAGSFLAASAPQYRIPEHGAASHISTSSTVGKRWGWARFRKLFAALRRRTARAAHEATDRGSSAAFRGAALPLIGGRGICALRARELCNGLPAAAAHTRRASWPHAASPPKIPHGGPWPRICGVGHGKGALVKEINQSPSAWGASSPRGV